MNYVYAILFTITLCSEHAISVKPSKKDSALGMQDSSSGAEGVGAHPLPASCVPERFVDNAVEQIEKLQKDLNQVHASLEEKRHTIRGAALKAGKQVVSKTSDTLKQAGTFIKDAGIQTADWARKKYDETDFKGVGTELHNKSKDAFNSLKNKSSEVMEWAKNKYDETDFKRAGTELQNKSKDAFNSLKNKSSEVMEWAKNKYSSYFKKAPSTAVVVEEDMTSAEAQSD